MQHEDERALALLGLDAHRLGIVDELAREIREQLGHPTSRLRDALDLDQAATASVGWAPLPSQSLTFASSSSIVEGSVCGL